MITTESLATATAPAQRRLLKGWLQGFGLEGLTDWAAGLLTDGASLDRIELELEDQQAFRDRFPAIFRRREQIASGRNIMAISASDVLSYERQVAELESFYGYPEGTLGDPQDRLVDDVSFSELENLVALEQDFLLSDPVTQQTFEEFYGIGATQGELVGAVINKDLGIPVLQQRIQAANVASQSVVAGFGDLTPEEAESLVARGVDEGGAREAFSLLARSRQLTQNFSRSDLLSLAAGEAPAIDRFERNQRSALAQFQGGGSFAGGTAGIA